MIQMNPLFFEQLDPIKIPLIQRFYKQHYPSAKVKKDELIMIARERNTLCAVVRFRKVEHSLLLTGMAVDQTKRKQGIGHQLLTFFEQQMLEKTVYCFAFDHLEDFYQQHRFHRQRPDDLPPAVQILYLRYYRQGKKIIPMKYEPYLVC